MNKQIVGAVVAVAALGFCAGGYWLLPALQGAQRTVETDASEQVERARRLLHQYNASLGYKSLLTDQLGERGIEVDPQDLSDEVEDEYQQIHAAMWEAYQPTDWRGDRLSPAHASYGNMPRQIEEGLRGLARVAGENERFLDDALRAVDDALAITVGDESSRSHAEANRLQAVVLYHKGLAAWTRAQLHRRQGDRYRRELAGLAAGAAAARSVTELVAKSNIEAETARLEEEGDREEDSIAEDRDSIAAVEDIIEEMENRLMVTERRRDDAARAFARLKTQGIDFSDPNGAERFRLSLERLNLEYRNADREAHALEYGTLPNAQMEQGGDFLTGRYLENGTTTDLTARFGLVHHRNRRLVLAARIDRMEEALENLRADVSRLEDMRDAYEADQRRAVEQIAAAASEASDTYTELNRVEAEAFTFEENALALLDRSAQASQSASRHAEQWVSAAADRTRTLSPEAKERSAFNSRANMGWLGAHIAAQEADARLAKAWIHYGRYHAYSHNAAILDKVVDALQLREADAEAERTKVQHAHDVGVEEISQAMHILERAHRQTGRHWTFTAQAAGTAYLLVLFGHEDYLDDAIETYREAVKGREDETFAATFVSRLSRLESR